MKSVLAASTAILLTACAGTNSNVYGCCFGQEAVGNKNFVTISNVWNEMDALPVAEQHCAKFNRSATFKVMNGYRATFDCVE